MDETTRRMYDLVREVRHDLNGPITSALGNIQMLLDDAALGEGDARASLLEIEADLRRLAGMIRRLTEVQPPDESA